MYFIGFFIILINILLAEYKENTLLFCLKPTQKPLIIKFENNKIKSGINEFDIFLNSSNIKNIEPWLINTKSVEHSEDIYLNRIYRLNLNQKNKTLRNQLINEIKNFNFIHSVEKEPIHKLLYTPNDPQYNQQWFLPQIQADDAWNFWNINEGEIPGNKNILLASVDTGVDWDHIDLINNIP